MRFWFAFAPAIVLASSLTAQQPPPDVPRCPFKAPREDCATMPRMKFTPEPDYPESVRRKRIQGTVFLGITIQPDGSVDDVKVTKSLEKSLDKQAIKTVRTWKFEPSMYEGKPIPYSTTVEVSFRLY